MTIIEFVAAYPGEYQWVAHNAVDGMGNSQRHSPPICAGAWSRNGATEQTRGPLACCRRSSSGKHLVKPEDFHLRRHAAAAHRRGRADRYVFLGGKLDRREIVASKAACQVFSHAMKLFISLPSSIGRERSTPVVAGLAIVASMIGATLAARVFAAMTASQSASGPNPSSP